MFLLIVARLEVTGTFKPGKQELAAQGYDPGWAGDLLYCRAVRLERYEPLDAGLFQRIMQGQEKLQPKIGPRPPGRVAIMSHLNDSGQEE